MIPTLLMTLMLLALLALLMMLVVNVGSSTAPDSGQRSLSFKPARHRCHHRGDRTLE
jgi:hypothetical protein